MNTYTITQDLLESIDDDEKIYFSDIMHVFTNRTNSFKVAKDSENHVIDIYRNITKNGDLIKHWLELMSYVPRPFEKIDVKISDIDCMETKFVKLCAHTKDSNKLIVYSKQNIKKFECSDGKIGFENSTILALDKDEAREILNSQSTGTVENYFNSQVAKDKGKINKSKNT